MRTTSKTRRLGRRWTTLAFAMAVVLGGALLWGGLRFTGAPHAVHAVYQCPMHPQIVQDHPGTCPICGMTLVKAEPKAGWSNGSS